MHRGAWVAAFAVGVFLAGCGQPSPTTAAAAKVTYGLNGTNYDSYSEALAALDDLEKTQIDAMSPAAEPHPGRALVVIPDRDRLRPLARQRLQQGRAPAPQLAAQIDSNLDNAITVEQHEVQAVVKAIERRRVFDAIEISERNDTVQPEIGDNQYLVWFQVRSVGADLSGPWVGNWMVRRRGAAVPAVFVYDPGVPPTRRLVSMMDSLNAALKSQGTASAK